MFSTAEAPLDSIDEEAQLHLKIDEIWQEYDKNGDNKLSKNEALVFLEKTLHSVTGFAHSKEDLEQYFDQIDLDKNGTLERAEGIEFLKKIYQGDSIE